MPSRHLEGKCPAWFSIEASSSLFLVGTAYVPGTLWSGSGVKLHIQGYSTLSVREESPGTKFPARCPERHIQRDQTFCLGLHTLEVVSDETAIQWWEQLRQYLCCQSIAEKTGISCEQKRKFHLEKYWQDARALGETCCGKMKSCGLR